MVSTVLIYWQTKDHGFIYFDDNVYVTENPHVKAGLTTDSVSWRFRHPMRILASVDLAVTYGGYHPFRLDPGALHLTIYAFTRLIRCCFFIFCTG